MLAMYTYLQFHSVHQSTLGTKLLPVKTCPCCMYSIAKMTLPWQPLPRPMQQVCYIYAWISYLVLFLGICLFLQNIKQHLCSAVLVSIFWGSFQAQLFLVLNRFLVLTGKRLSQFSLSKNMKTIYAKVFFPKIIQLLRRYMFVPVIYIIFHKTKFAVQTLHKCFEVNIK